MRRQNSVFHDLLKHIPWDAFERLVTGHGADKHVRRLPTKSQFIALPYGQLSGASSLREIAGGLIAYLLPQLAQAAQKAIDSPRAFARLVRVNLMHRKRIDRLLEPKTPPPGNSNQMAIQWT